MSDANLTALLRLQDADMRKKDMEARLQLLPKEMDALIARRDKLNSEIVKAADAVKQEELAIKKRENEIAQLTDKSQKLQQQSALVKKIMNIRRCWRRSRITNSASVRSRRNFW